MQGYRFEQRKKQRMNRILNVAIGIVVILILVFGAQILLNPSTEKAVSDEDITDESPEDEQAIPDLTEEDPKDDDERSNDQEETVETDEDMDEDMDEEMNKVEDLEPVPDGEWEPVGTEQEGEFSHDFNRSGANWAEMEKALRYSTGLDDDMDIWRLENGGSPTRARGVVSAPDSPDHPYEVYIEWVDGQGWVPVEKNQLPNNPYRG